MHLKVVYSCEIKISFLEFPKGFSKRGIASKFQTPVFNSFSGRADKL